MPQVRVDPRPAQDTSPATASHRPKAVFDTPPDAAIDG
jgi:hypothetical protein